MFTNPLQGEKFHEMWAHLMDCPIDYHECTNSKNGKSMKTVLMDHYHTTNPLLGCIGTNETWWNWKMIKQIKQRHQ